MIGLISLVIFSTLTVAGVPAQKKHDFNGDGKPDFVEVFVQGQLTETHYDSDADGKFDRHMILDPDAEVFKIIDLDRTRLQPRKRISFWDNKIKKQTVAFVQLDKNNDGDFEISYEITSDIDQKRKTCSVTIPGEAETLSEQVLAACVRAEDYTQTDFGYRVHKSCTENDRSWVLPMVRDSITQGRACLTRLSQRGMRGAARNLSSLESILATGNVQIICNETSYDWASSVAHATTGSERATEDLPLVHPGISLGPINFRERSAETDLEFKRTLFHEQLHNLGHRHGIDPEISYTCETCCFPGTDALETEVACKVCGGDYSSITDPQYLEDITEYGRASLSRKQARAAALAYLRENTGDELGLSYLAVNSGGIFGPVGDELTRILSERNLSARDRAVLDGTPNYHTYAALDPYRPGGRVVATAYVKLFGLGNPEEALHYLRENADVLRQQLALRTGEDGEFMAENLRENLDVIVFEVWIRGYRGRAPTGQYTDAVANQAYELKKLLGLR